MRALMFMRHVIIQQVKNKTINLNIGWENALKRHQKDKLVMSHLL